MQSKSSGTAHGGLGSQPIPAGRPERVGGTLSHLSPTRLLYLALQAVASALLAPIIFWLLWLHRGRWADVGQRFGFYRADVRARLQSKRASRCWIHAASIGEAQVALALIDALHAHRPGLGFVVSTMTQEGRVILEKRRFESMEVIFLPLDLAWCLKRAYRLIQPDVVVPVEMEFWPNFLWLAKSRQVPVCVVNARMPEADFRRYRSFAWFFRSVFRVPDHFCAQTAEDAARLMRLGVSAERIQVTGSLKYEVLRAFTPTGQTAEAILRKLGVPSGVPVLVAGSTCVGEEAIFLDLLARLEREFGRVLLVIVPREISRAGQIVAMAVERGISAARRSDVDANTGKELSRDETTIAVGRAALTSQPEAAPPLGCLVMDSIGELRDFYAIATVSFVGRSITGYGGHNPLEPVAAGCPVIFGRNMQNFAPIAQQLVAAGVATQVAGVKELQEAIRQRLAYPADREQLAAAARRMLQDHAGAMEQTVDALFASAPSLRRQPLANCAPHAV